jgi:hypothetical protein
MNISKYINDKISTKYPIHEVFYTKTNDTECACNISCPTGICSDENIKKSIMKYVKDKTNKLEKSAEEALNKAKKILNCDSESCVLLHPDFKDYADEDIIQTNLLTRFKTPGPRNSTKLLSNFNIDETLAKWNLEYPDFYHCPFTMIDFNDYPKYKFGRINLGHLITGKEIYKDLTGNINKGPFNTYACVLNTDVSTGRGKHWVCIFADFRNKNNWTIEYFNSSGNKPCRPVIHWMEKQKLNVQNETGIKPETISVTNLVHQDSQTECGVYSLYYIRCRLDGISHLFFFDNLISDDKMIEFRKHIFRHN